MQDVSKGRGKRRAGWGLKPEALCAWTNHIQTRNSQESESSAFEPRLTGHCECVFVKFGR